MKAIFAPLLEIHLADAVDIIVVTTLVYTAIVWFRRTHAALAAFGIVILGLLYVAADRLGLQLTTWIFGGFFAIFLIIIVVIFQEELRQLFERLALFGLRRNRRVVTPADTSDTLVQCLADLARERVGALVVVKGEQPIGRHVRGGIELNGTLSVPILKSIFEPHSPGHDGAVIIEDGRIARFAAHLPLSSDFQQLVGRGTRHSAALGLSELTDALCLVVSEERGRISVSYKGRLREIAEPAELRRLLEKRDAARKPGRRSSRFWINLVRENWIEKLAALAVVVTLWLLYVPGSRPAQVVMELPVAVINLPEGFVLHDVSPRVIEATLSGPARAFYLLDASRLEVTIDATLAKLGRRTFTISEDNVAFPRDLTIEALHPAQVRVSLTKGAETEEGAAGG